MKKVLRLTI